MNEMRSMDVVDSPVIWRIHPSYHDSNECIRMVYSCWVFHFLFLFTKAGYDEIPGCNISSVFL